MVLLPKQEYWDKNLYRMKNPICPHLIFECCNRIFKRKEHGCLSGANKPKAVEVVLKFAKLHDHFDFDDEEQVRSYFDDILFLDFMKYGSRCQPLLQATIDGMIRGYNETPENFGVPSDEVIDEVIRLVDEQMEIDSRVEIPLVEHHHQAEQANQSTPPWESKRRHDDDQSEHVGRPALDSNEEHKVSAEPTSSAAV